MKQLLTTIAVWLAVTGLALAGNEADISITTSIDESGMQGMFGELEPDGAEVEMPQDAMEPVTMNGHMFWTEDAMRIDFDSFEGAGPSSTIYNFTEGVMYQLDHNSRTATRFVLNDLSSAGAEEMGGMGIMEMIPESPEEMIHNWQEMQESLQSMEGINFLPLGNQTVNNRNCAGYSISMDASQMGMQGMSEGSGGAEDDMFGGLLDMIMGMLQIDMEVWVDESISLPVSLSMNLMGITTDMNLTNITEWSVNQSKFLVPGNYDVEDFEMPELDEFNNLPPGATIPGQAYISEG